MSTYAIGDLQGCYQAFRCLLEQVTFNPDKDQLWLAGDLVNRGPDSLKTLRYIHSLGEAVIAVLGNHDLHLLAIAHGSQTSKPKDTLQDILDAPDRQTLLNWLQQRPLLHHDKKLGYTMVHAGIPPQWSLSVAQKLAREVEDILQSENAGQYFAHMYGDQPDCWSEKLSGFARLRLITNYFTRMRFINNNGALDLSNKRQPSKAAPGTLPWYQHPTRKTRQDKIIFGHWAALQGEVGNGKETDNCHLFALDTGCVWGGKLTMMRLEDQQYFSCNCADDNTSKN